MTPTADHPSPAARRGCSLIMVHALACFDVKCKLISPSRKSELLLYTRPQSNFLGTPSTQGAFSHSARTARAQRQLLP